MSSDYPRFISRTLFVRPLIYCQPVYVLLYPLSLICMYTHTTHRHRHMLYNIYYKYSSRCDSIELPYVICSRFGCDSEWHLLCAERTQLGSEAWRNNKSHSNCFTFLKMDQLPTNPGHAAFSARCMLLG